MSNERERLSKASWAVAQVRTGKDPYNDLDLAKAAIQAYLNGDVVVPIAPTMEMRAAAVNTGLPGLGEPPLYEKIWRAMIRAATDSE